MWCVCVCRCSSAGSRGRRLAAEPPQQPRHLQQRVDAFGHPHVGEADLLEEEEEEEREFTERSWVRTSEKNIKPEQNLPDRSRSDTWIFLYF